MKCWAQGDPRYNQGTRTLKDAMNEALCATGSPTCMIRLLHRHRRRPASLSDDGARFQSIIGVETRAQMQEAEGRLPGFAGGLHGGGSNAIGLFHSALDRCAGVQCVRRRPPARRLKHSTRIDRGGWNNPIALEPPPMQATSESGSRPSASCICAAVSTPMIDWKSRTIIG